jgi:hypothetical protein
MTRSSILFQISDKVFNWSDDTVYQILGFPNTEDVYTTDGSPPEPYAASQVVAPYDTSDLFTSPLAREDILFIDFGQSFFGDHPPPHYTPATTIIYLRKLFSIRESASLPTFGPWPVQSLRSGPGPHCSTRSLTATF